jgi:hypothetical protein
MDDCRREMPNMDAIDVNKVVSCVVYGYPFLFSGARVHGTCRFSLI